MRTVSYNTEALVTAFFGGLLLGFALASGWIG